MQTQYLVFIYSLLGSLTSWLVAVALVGSKKISKVLANYATPFAAGAFLATVFFDLLPEGLDQAEASQVLTSVLIGLLVFFYLERFLRWFHHHNHNSKGSSYASVTLIIVGDVFHNALDGVAIATAFLINVPAGIIVTLAIVAHEIPQTISNFGYMLNKKITKKNTIIINLCNSLVTVPAATAVYFLGSSNKLPLGILLGLSAGLLLYIATADIIPAIHDKTDQKPLHDIRPLVLVLGVISVALAIQLANHIVIG